MKIAIPIQAKYQVMADQLVVSGAGFCTSLLLARALGIVEFGRFSGIVMIQLFILSITMAFTTQVYQVVQPSLNEGDARLFTKGLLGQQIGFAALLLLVVLAACFAFPLSVNRLGGHAQATVLWAGVATVLYLLQDFLRRVFITCNKTSHALIIDVLNNALQLAGLCWAWYYHQLTLCVAWAIIALSYLPAVATGMVLLNAGKLTKAAAGFTWKVQKSKSGWLLGSSLLQWGAGYFFVMAAGWYIGAAALGALRLAQYIFGILNVLLQAIESYALPRAAAHTAHLQHYWRVLLQKSLLLMLPVLIALSVFARPVLTLAGGVQYAQYAFVMYGLSLVYVLITIGYPVRIAIRSLHLDKAYFMAYILAVAVSVAVAPWLLQHWQLYGVLCGLFLSQFICITYWLIILQRKKSLLWKSYT
ncbi:Membrane protein involved in the export of O-antigen and teichoic acid [Filimonas lacunae]|uniref:Membrane protein involved in the export of O-antigen and teichoic acid n=1 Tax=Filimonas lacunae TaxID=477680 RepID=A0A173MHC8_9BACT|nr:hypothetical protein [Filimonas lacunae]BAV06890.1 integral membrane protein [Filimonas lacunae]SIS98294.1 Membrane protein involved in the export of O-antigen and teichoic acid [Filimonas lacunae]